MATVAINQYHSRQFGGFTPYGNVTSLKYELATKNSGGALNADSDAPLEIGDVVDLGPLPEGMCLEDATVLIKTAMTTAVKGDLGFVYSDGEDDAAVPQNASYFGSGMVLNAVARLRATGVGLVSLPKPARLTLTIAGAANAKASELAVIVTGELTGPK